MFEVAPTSRFSSSSRKPLLMARATPSVATPAITPTTEIAVITEMTAWRRFALRYRRATKNSKRISCPALYPQRPVALVVQRSLSNVAALQACELTTSEAAQSFDLLKLCGSSSEKATDFEEHEGCATLIERCMLWRCSCNLLLARD